MIRKIFRRVQLLLNPLKNGDVLYGDCCEFGLRSATQQIWHGLKRRDGTAVCSHWCGDDTYRLTVESTSMPYYIFNGEVLTRLIDENGGFMWKNSCQKRRMEKSKIHNMILEGKVTRKKQ